MMVTSLVHTIDGNGDAPFVLEPSSQLPEEKIEKTRILILHGTETLTFNGQSAQRCRCRPPWPCKLNPWGKMNLSLEKALA